jgi:heme/copper-type cytochrome/quinol oxidase subunit 2
VDKTITIKPEMETSAFIEVFTAILPFILLVIIGVVVIVIVYTIKIVKHNLAGSKVTDQQWDIVKTDIKEIKKRLDRLEKGYK